MHDRETNTPIFKILYSKQQQQQQNKTIDKSFSAVLTQLSGKNGSLSW